MVLSTNSGDALVKEIRTQKRVELWGEGLAFFDMKRTNTPLERNYTGSNHPTWGKINIQQVRLNILSNSHKQR